jgi:hypothetical protein
MRNRLAVPFIVTSTLGSGCTPPRSAEEGAAKPTAVRVSASAAPVDDARPSATPPVSTASAAPPSATAAIPVMRTDRFEVPTPPGRYPASTRLFARLVTAAKGDCHLHVEPECPGALCNPPPPYPVMCAGSEWHVEAIDSKAYPQPSVLWRRITADKSSCTAWYHVDCGPGSRCNPPAPRPIACP